MIGLRDLLLFGLPFLLVLALCFNAFYVMRKDVRNGVATVQPMWILIVLLFPVVGSILYFLLGRLQVREKRTFNPDFSKVKK